MSRRVRVLFCGHEFASGYAKTLEYVRAHGLDVDVERCAREDVSQRIADADVAVPLMTRLDAAALERGAAGSLRLVLQFGVGLEGVDVDAASRVGVRVGRIPSERTGNASSTAEMAVFLLLASLRRANDMAASVANRTLGDPLGRALEDCEVMIVGWGAIGAKIGERLRPFGCSMTAARRGRWEATDEARALGLRDACSIGEEERFKEMLGTADAVVIACTQDSSNKGMIDATFLASLKKGAMLVNIARGGLFHREDLLDALNRGQLGYLASDVAWSEPVDPHDDVVKHPNAYFTPHVGGVTEFSYETMGRIMATSAAAFDRFEELDDIQLVN